MLERDSESVLHCSFRVKVNVEPIPGWDLTEIVPPISSIKRLLIVRPKPTPDLSSPFPPSYFLKSLNSLLRFYCLIPIPVSSTLNLSITVSIQLSSLLFSSQNAGTIFIKLIFKSILPLSVNLIEFPIMLNKIYLILLLSPKTMFGTFYSKEQFIESLFISL